MVRLRIWREPDLSGEYPVDERGEVVFPKIGPMLVTRLSADSLRLQLVQTYSTYLRDPSIEVTLLRRVNVQGAVKTPGLYQVDQTQTVADVLAQAGGATPDGKADRVELIRDGNRMGIRIDRPAAELVLAQFRSSGFGQHYRGDRHRGGCRDQPVEAVMAEFLSRSGKHRYIPIAEVPSPPPPEQSLGELATMVKRQWTVMVVAPVVVALLVAAYTVRVRPTYEATSVLRFEKEELNLPQLVQQLATENRISTEMEVLQGRSAAEAVIDSLGLRAELVSPRKGLVTELFPILRVAASADTGRLAVRADGDSGFAVWRLEAPSRAVWSPMGEPVEVAGVTLALGPAAAAIGDIRLEVVSRDEALRKFAKALKVTRPVRDADLIKIRFRNSDPELAARVANQLAGHLIVERQAELRRRTGIAVDFLREQLDTLGGQLQTAEDALRSYRERVGAVDPKEQARTQVGRLVQLEADRGSLEAEQVALSTLLRQIRLEEAAVPDGPSPYRRLIAFPTLLRNPSAGQLLGTLAVVENERATLLQRRTWQDPDVTALSARVDDLDRQLRGIAETYLQGLTNQLAGMDQVGRRFGRELSSLPRKEVNSARLEREAGVLQEMYSLVQTRLKESEITQAMQDPTVRIADVAVAPAKPIRPRPEVNLSLSLVLGSLLGLGVSLAREMNDRSVRSRADALEVARLPVLAAIPRVEAKLPGRLRRLGARRKRPAIGPRGSFSDPTESLNGSRTIGEIRARLISRPDTPRAYAESFNQLHANLALAHQDRPLKVLVFTSPLPGEGKTLSAINFALTAAARRLRVLLIDADMRCGMINQVFGCSREPGFAELVSGSSQFADGARRIEVGDGISFVLLPAGALSVAPGRVMSVERVRAALAGLANKCDLVVIDSPPVNLLADAALLGASADGVIVVVRAGKTEAEALRFAMDQLTATRAPLLGTVLNDLDTQRYGYEDGSNRYLAEAEKYYATRG